TAIHANERQPYASVSGGCFDDYVPWLEPALLLRPANDPYCGTVFHTAAGIQVFEFGEDHGGVLRDNTLQAKHWSLPNEFRDVLGNSQARLGGCGHSTG